MRKKKRFKLPSFKRFKVKDRKLAYQRFLKSKFWKSLCIRVKKRDGFKCKHCGTRKNLQVHHLFYRKNWYETRMGDLVTLCKTHHERAHGK